MCGVEAAAHPRHAQHSGTCRTCACSVDVINGVLEQAPDRTLVHGDPKVRPVASGVPTCLACVHA